MISDLAATAGATTRDCDLLILGAGPAGMTLALETARAAPDARIVLAEAGGLQPSNAAEMDLYQGKSIGGSNYSLTATRLRYFGGTSGHWGGWCRPLDAIDFVPRHTAGIAGWPLRREALEPHYAAAHHWLEIPSRNYDPDQLSPALRQQLLDFGDSSWLRNQIFRFSPPTRFGDRYRDPIAQAENIECLLNAAAVDYQYQGSRLDQVTLSGLHGHSLKIRAKQVVIAMGGIENARHLLVMRQVGWSIAGLHTDHLGRGFADHFGLRPGVLEIPANKLYQRTSEASGDIMPIITPSPEALHEMGWSNACMMLEVTPKTAGLPNAYHHNQSLGFAGGDYWRYTVQMILEPRANEASQLTLDAKRDALGLPRSRLAWEIDPRDYQSAHAFYQRFGLELGRLGLGRVRFKALDIGKLRRQASGAAHHMGTARMADTAEQGVVDTNLKVFGSDNLYVAGSAVFPSYGFSNPTLTIVALAHRLAGHIVTSGTLA